mmetsp:Transcript_13671/g.61388  ORF Transcript_13671/g.61388 Transcript_13671/m.61388 type:complete len:205 (+) Transcript_13671:310-924(+)
MRDDPDPDGKLAWARAVAKADALVALSHEVRASAEKRARFKQAAGAYADPRSRASRTQHERERAAEGVAKEMGVEVPAARETTTAVPPAEEALEATASTPVVSKPTAEPETLGKSASSRSDRSDASVGNSAGGTAGGGERGGEDGGGEEVSWRLRRRDAPGGGETHPAHTGGARGSADSRFGARHRRPHKPQPGDGHLRRDGVR